MKTIIIPVLLLLPLFIVLAEDKAKTPPTPPDPQTEIALLKAQLASAIADREATEVQFQLQMQVCNSLELVTAKAKMIEAKKQVEAAKPKPPDQPAPKKN